MSFKKFLKKIIPKSVLNLRHLCFAWLGAVKFNHPSDELYVIGRTGTSGKSSTTAFLRQLLEEAGFTVGSLSTVDFYIAGEKQLNDQKMTMLGKMKIQEYLREMVEKKCDIAIVETTSEGRVQHRHRCINYDMMLLTNLYPEHIDSHGSFENYKQAKVDLFHYTANCTKKPLPKRAGEKMKQLPFGKKIAIANGDIDYTDEFLQFEFDKTYRFGKVDKTKETFVIKHREISAHGLNFDVKKHHFSAPVQGEYNMMNILSVITLSRALGIDWECIQDAIKKFSGVPGRIEFIPEAEKKDFSIIVDYAFEPVAIKALYKVVRLHKPKRIIHVFGSTGGGRDVERRFTVGEYVGKKADICIVTDEDPYDDDPLEIMEDVASAVEKMGKRRGKNLFLILEREEAIQKAVNLAEPGDMVLITGKGSEQGMVVQGELIPWDDRAAARRALQSKT